MLDTRCIQVYECFLVWSTKTSWCAQHLLFLTKRYEAKDASFAAGQNIAVALVDIPANISLQMFHRNGLVLSFQSYLLLRYAYFYPSIVFSYRYFTFSSTLTMCPDVSPNHMGQEQCAEV